MRISLGLQDDADYRHGKLHAEVDLRAGERDIVVFFLSKGPTDPGNVRFSVATAELRALLAALEAVRP